MNLEKEINLNIILLIIQMKIISYEQLEKGIILHFEQDFNQIKYLKMKTDNFKDQFGELECDETEIKFTKPKRSLNIYKDKSEFINLYLKEIDNHPINVSYFIKLDQNETSPDMSSELLERGLCMLLGGNEKRREEDLVTKRCSIKNGNIFADIRRKSDGNTKAN